MANDIARLGFVVESDSVETAGSRLDRLNDQAAKTERAVSKSAKDMGSNFESSMTVIKRAAAQAGAALAAAFSVRALASAADQWSDLQSVVGAAIKDMEAAPAVMQEINRLARASYSSLSQTAEGFARNVQALRDLGYSTQGALDYTEALNNALVITATRGQRAESVQSALSKAMATGRLQADGLETVLANGGRVAEALAAELGTTVSGLRKLSSEGKITGDVIARALTGRLQELREEAGEMPATLADGFGQIANSFTMFVGIMDQASGASSIVAEILVAVADNFNMVAGYVAAAAIGVTGLYIPAILSAVASTAAWVASLVTLKALLIASGLGAFIVLAGALIGKLLDLVKETGSFQAAIEVAAGVGVASLKWLEAGAAALGDVFAGVALRIQGYFTSLWANVLAGFASMMASIQTGVNAIVDALNDAFTFDKTVSVFGKEIGLQMEGLGINRATFADGFADMAGAAAGAADEIHRAADAAFEMAGGRFDGLETPAAALERLRQAAIDAGGAVSGVLDEAGSAGPSTGSSDEKGKKGRGGKSEAEKAADKAREALEKLRKEHRDLQATIGMTAEQERLYHAVQELGAGATAAQVAEVQRLIPEIDRLKDAKERMARAAENGKQALDNLFGSVIDGSKSAKQAVLDLLAQIARVQMMNAIFRLPGMGRIGQSLGQALTPSFDGGGFTGSGPRSGGVDGRGGFPAILHPNETVIDHTRGQQSARMLNGGAGNITYAPTIHIGGNVSQDDLANIRMELAREWQQLPATIARINREQRVRAG